MRWLAAILLACAFAALPAAAQQKRIALTFDDTPRGVGAFLDRDARAAKLIAALKAAGVKQAAFFVNPGNIRTPAGKRDVAAYAAAGHVIANHSFSHPGLSKSDARGYLANIDMGEAVLKPLPGYRPWFRFPFLDEGGRDKVKRDALRAGLAARGLRNGYVTAESSDWHIEALAVAAKKAGKPMDMAALRDLYVESHVEAAEYYDALAVKAIGASPRHVMLLHETDLAALFIGDLVTALRGKGWQVITADAAYDEPLLRDAAPDTPSAQGALIEQIAWEKKLPAPRWYARNDTKLLDRLFAQRVLGEQP